MITEQRRAEESVTWPKAILVPPVFATAILAMFSQAANPFLYFQF